MLSYPNCKTLKSIASLKKKKELDEDGREQMNCKVCNYSWKRFHLLTGGGDGGGSDGGFGLICTDQIKSVPSSFKIVEVVFDQAIFLFR